MKNNKLFTLVFLYNILVELDNKIKILIIISISVVFIIVVSIYFLLDDLIPINQENNDDNILDIDDFNQQVLRQEVTQELQNFKMKKRIIIKEKDRPLIKRKEDFSPISDYQKYVTPNNPIAKEYQTSNGLTNSQLAYNNAVEWTWVSDSTLHGEYAPEKWLMPAEFINDTPDKNKYPTNPVDGMASDCESQAYTLVSILEALGIQKSNVRVVVGEVDFYGETGGHAWVQIYENGEWFELEATSGPYWDDEDQKLVENKGFPYNYFKNHPYPVEEYWAFFNDIYYYNPDNNKKSPDLPTHWEI